MIKEITNYIKLISDSYPLSDFVSPNDGLHIHVRVANGKADILQYELYRSKKGKDKDTSEFLRYECLPREMYIDWLGTNKTLDIPGRKIHSASPFALKFKKTTLEPEEPKDVAYLKEWENKVEAYFNKAIEASSLQLSEEDKETLDTFISYCKHFLRKDIQSLPVYAGKDGLKSGEYIILCLENFTAQQYEETYKKYFSSNLFNKNDYNEPVEGNIYGLSNFYNGDNSKKPYLQHLSANFQINYRIDQDTAYSLHLFDQYRRAKAFVTNPLPIFIDKLELNSLLVKAVKLGGENISFHQIIRDIYMEKQDLGNYYLIYFAGPDIKDLDFVSSFSFHLDLQIRNLFGNRPETNIRDVFAFEREVLAPVFNNQLVQKRKDDSYAYKYFEEPEVKPEYGLTEAIFHLLHQYRLSWYNFIYKSRRQSITGAMFHDMMRSSILDDIRRDEYDGKYHTKQRLIEQKLNIWYSLWSFFDNTNKENDLTMANNIETLRERIRSVANDHDQHLAEDPEYAFASGQLIYFLLTKSRASDRTHAPLDNFLQKTKDVEFKRALANTFNAYKHEISFGKGRFEKLCSEAMGYEYKGNVKDLMPHILAGYFSDSIIYEKNNNQQNNQENE